MAARTSKASTPPAVELTDKQKAFVAEYLVDLNGTQAAIRAGYSRDSARQIASENLSKPDIAEAIDKALAERGGVTRTRIVDELARIGFADIREVVSWRPEVIGIEPPEDDEDGEPVKVIQSRVTVLDSATLTADTAAAIAEVSQGAQGQLRIKMHDKPAALERLGRALGMFKDRLEHTGKDGAPLIPTAARVIFEDAGGPAAGKPAAKAAPRLRKPRD